ncbi:MAG: alpha/beta hydrolase [Deltaproteobacteria bacterium]|nr:alpha/beta hydrolase [Deltaproteobacteria bacterium]
MPVAWREESLVVDGVRLPCWVAGEGPPVLIFHGADGGNGLLPFHHGLAARFRVWAPSLPGFGRAELPAWLESVDDLAYFSLDLVEHLGLRETNVMGMGFGGWVVAEMAVRCQDRLRRLVLADAVGIKVSGPETRDIADLFVLPREEAARLTWHDPRAAEGMKVPGTPGLSEGELTGLLRAAQTVITLGWKPFLHNPQLLRRLGRLRVPTLVLWGQSDRVVSPDYGRAYHQAIPGSTFQVIARAGHYPHRERPDEFVKAVTAFLL